MRSVIVGSLLVVVGCGGASEPTATTVDPVGMAQAVAAGISADTLLAEVERLASDAFEGRAPGSEGETRTIEYLREQFSTLGLAPGNPDGTWVQNVPLVGITPVEGDTLRVSRGDDTRTLEPGADYVAYTKRVVDRVEVDAEFVFVGYGAVAPEYDWNDFKDVDVTGKILLFLVNDPPSDGLFGGQAMTYYGRWTYKHEIAGREGGSRVARDSRARSGRLSLGGGGEQPVRRVVRPGVGRPQHGARGDRGLDSAGRRGVAVRDGRARLRDREGQGGASRFSAGRAGRDRAHAGAQHVAHDRLAERCRDAAGCRRPGRGGHLHGTLGPPREGRESDRRPDLQRGRRQRDRHSRADRAGARPSPWGSPRVGQCCSWP